MRTLVASSLALTASIAGALVLSGSSADAACSAGCIRVMANGVCNLACNIADCEFDGGDCVSKPTKKPTRKPVRTGPTVPTRATKKPTLRPKVTAKPTRPTKAPTKATKKPTKKPTSSGIDTSKWNVEVIFDVGVTDDIKTTFITAKNLWESVITGDIPDVFVYEAGTSCGQEYEGRQDTSFDEDRNIDDLLIFASTPEIDGQYNILGMAGPCWASETNGRWFPRVGIMMFDIADMDLMNTEGILDTVIIHEMGHIIGIGTLWMWKNTLVDLSSVPYKYLGANGNEGDSDIGGDGQAQVEETGGSGTAKSHWRESTYNNELMTGWVDSGENPLSMLTVKSLIDLGYTVDTSKAEEFTRPGLRSSQGKKFFLGDDVLHVPLMKGKTIKYSELNLD